MRRCHTCVYQGIKPYNKPCNSCECTSDYPDGTKYLENTEDNKDMTKDFSTQVTDSISDVGVDDGTAATSPHYNSLGVQPIEFMEDTLTYEEFKGFLKGNMIKYAFRAGKKDPMEKDINKYNQYRDWYDMCCAGLRVSATLKK